METELDETRNCVKLGMKLKEDCLKCLQLEDDIAKASEKCVGLELDIRKKNSLIEVLERKIGVMEIGNLRIEGDNRYLKQKIEDLENSVRKGEDEENKVTELMIENSVLECEKKAAESAVEAWISKCKELEMEVSELRAAKALESEVYGGEGVSGNHTPSKQYMNFEGMKLHRACVVNGSVRKSINFTKDEGVPYERISPTTPGVRPYANPIVISDSDDDHLGITPKMGRVAHRVTPENENDEEDITPISITWNKKRLNNRSDYNHNLRPVNDTSCENFTPRSSRLVSDNEDEDLVISMSKKRKVTNRVTSESESDSEDDTPLNKRKNKRRLTRKSGSTSNLKSLNDSSSHLVVDYDDLTRKSGSSCERPVRRRRLVRLGGEESGSLKGNARKKKLEPKIVMEVFDVEDETGDDNSCSESLSGFIVNDSHISDDESYSTSDDASKCNSNEPKISSISNSDTEFAFNSGELSKKDSDVSEDAVGFIKMLSCFRRDRKDRSKWANEGEMLADFGKSPELCMTAVCALYRQQTSDEQSCKSTFVVNGRGFSQFDALSGSELAEFLTNEDGGDVKKSVEDLQKVFPNGVETCEIMARKYSKQLFEIYMNGEDQFFGPL